MLLKHKSVTDLISCDHCHGEGKVLSINKKPVKKPIFFKVLVNLTKGYLDFFRNTRGEFWPAFHGILVVSTTLASFILTTIKFCGTDTIQWRAISFLAFLPTLALLMTLFSIVVQSIGKTSNENV